MQSSSLKLFASADQKPMLLKRQAFAMFSGELDQYHLYLPLIQGGLPLHTSLLALVLVFRLESNKAMFKINWFFATPFRAPHRDFANESEPRCVRPDVLDVPCSPVADLIPASDVALAYNGHRACKLSS